MTVETWELEIIKALGTRGPLHPMQLMPLAYPFGIREGGRSTEEQRNGKKADYIHTVVRGLMVKGLVCEVDKERLELTVEGWKIHGEMRGD